ncbi:biotin carboxylase [Leptospira perolatii]|uniref:Biotin carboxylase n=1 Tax=Leptospira perolatii TaxID=2023191 RepID=A0A2M9ZQK3_9LEPT|nr:ATP-grasp domain-containing protein [Leptospira perolatii]PJZ70403.1 biotin carboxylase [Leptospira perolatii]PJZ74239.1 biotin carboxylase [Leptospira perolatii]
MKRKGYFLSIGAGQNQLPLIQACLGIGLEVIAVDRNDTAPGFASASLRILESTHEYRKIYKAVSESPLHTPVLGIGTRSFGKATYSTAFLAEKLKLRYASIDSVHTFSDKKILKEVCGKKGIKTPKEIPWTELNAKKKSFPYPWIAKPSQGSGKHGVRLIKSDEDASKFFSSVTHSSHKQSAKGVIKKKVPAKKAGNTKQELPKESWVLEEYITGIECTVLGLVDSHNFHLVGITLNDLTEFPPFLEISHRLPFSHPELIGEIKMLCSAITKLTGLKNCPFVAEFRIDREGELFLLEASPEVGGEHLADVLVPGYYGYDYFANLVKLLIGAEFTPPTSLLKVSRHKKAQIHFEVPPKGISILKSNAQFVLDSHETVLYENNLKDPGSRLDTNSGNECRTKVIGIRSDSNISEEVWNKSVSARMRAEFDVR